MKATGSLFWLSGSLFKVGEGAQEDRWHGYIVIYCNREIVILNPEYGGPVGVKECVGNFNGMWLAKELLAVMSQRQSQKVSGESCWGRAINRIRIGRTRFEQQGEEPCVAMSWQWLEGFVRARCPIV